MLRDLHLAARRLFRQPAHTCLMVTILALGLGAAITMFSLVNAASLRSLPFPAPERLVRVQVGQGDPRTGFYFLPPFVFRHLQAHNEVFEAMTAVAMGNINLIRPGEPPEMVWSLKVTADFFRLLGVPPALGRAFRPDEDQPGRNAVVILSARLWQERFGGDPAVLGRTVRLGERTYTVVGVMPAVFSDPLNHFGRVDLWRPMGLSAESMSRTSRESLEVWGRLRHGVGHRTAVDHLDALLRGIGDGQHREVRVKWLGAKRGIDDEHEAAVWFALALAVVVLLIACTNLAGLQLARLAGRGHEQAIRVALGASRARLAREALAESLLVSAVGGALGVLIAVWCTEPLAARMVMLNGGPVTVGIPVAVDGMVVLFALVAALASAVIVGLAPIWLGARRGLFDALRRGGGATTDRGRPRLRQGLVVAEMAMALVLLMGGGLFLRGLQRLQTGHPGWEIDGLMTARLAVSGTRYVERPARAAFFEALSRKLAAIPGVSGVALATWLPIAEGNKARYLVEGGPGRVSLDRPYLDAVSPSYFATLGITLREGRLLSTADVAAGLPVVVINEAMARGLWPGQSPLGRRIAFGITDPSATADSKAWKTIVGVVSDVQFPGAVEEVKSRYQAYHPLAQALPSGVRLALRTAGPPEALAGPLRRAVAELDPNLVMDHVLSARALRDRELANYTLTAWVVLVFAALGLLLAALGVYGLFSGFVVERTREIGVRVALGARQGQVLAMVLSRGLRLAGAGALAGMLGALGLVPVLRAIAYGLPPHEPAAVLALAGVLVAVALLACWLPARRAAALEPMKALRQE